MVYRSMMDAVRDLESTGQLVRIREEVDPDLEMAEVHRRVFDAKGPALYFERIKGSRFPAVSNIFGTYTRTEFLFRHTIENASRVISLKADPTQALKNPLKAIRALPTALTALPRRKRFRSPVLYGTCQISDLPQIKSWPMDGGAFVTMPQVATLPPGVKKVMQSNIGMYRIQLSGNEYVKDREVGMHYQLHRGIGVHHTQYNHSEEPFRASIFVGGPPAHSFAAIMPLPEGLSEMTFAGMLAGSPFQYGWNNGHLVSANADFCITGIIRKDLKKPEGPFGDHLGYYSLTHDFPVMEIDRVYHRKDAVWHFSVVGRPPQEDSSFGYLIHKLVKEMTPVEFPGLVDVHAVDEAGVHPLLLAIGKERYMPFREEKPEEILTIANRLLGSGQTSLAKFLIIAAQEPGINLSAHDYPTFFRHFLERANWKRDLHFHTRTTIDTLDYSGTSWNEGSKVVMACRGPAIRSLNKHIPSNFRFPDGLDRATFLSEGILCLRAEGFQHYSVEPTKIRDWCDALKNVEWTGIPLILLCDDPEFTAANWNNFLWVTFTRANPSHDIYGVDEFVEFKHWGCRGPLVIDARKKPHHAPELIVDPEVTKRANRFFTSGGPLAKFG